MAKKCLVYNNNPDVEVWEETFKGEKVKIKRGQPIEMEFFEAYEFRGQYYPTKMLGNNTQDPMTFKMIKVEPILDLKEEIQVETGFRCNACKETFISTDLLTKHSEEKHAHLITKDDALEEELKIKRKPGRPAKTETLGDHG